MSKKQRDAVDRDYARNFNLGKNGNTVTDITRSIGGSKRAKQAYGEGKKQRGK